MTKPAKIEKRPLTEKQSLFCKYMYTIGSSSFGNGTESARRAGYKGDDNTLAATATRLLRNVKIIAEKQRIQAETRGKLDHNRQIAIDKLNSVIDVMFPLAVNGDSRAAAQVTAAIRELDAISNLHSSKLEQTGAGLSINVSQRAPEAITPEEGSKYPRIADRPAEAKQGA